MGRKTSARRHGVWRTDGAWNALVAVAVIALCAVTGASDRLERALYDAATRVHSPAPLADIAIVGIDETSVAGLGPLPWSNDIHALLIDQLARAGAKTIVYTPSLSQSDSDLGLGHIRKIKAALTGSADGSPLAAELSRLTTEAESALDTDARLVSSLQKAGNVLLTSSYAASGTSAALPAYARRSALPDPGARAIAVQSALHPAAKWGLVAAGTGHLNALADADGKIRKLPLLLRYNDSGIPSLALLAAVHSLHLGGDSIRIQDSPPALRLGSLEIATDISAVMRPRMYGTDEGAPPFTTTPFVTVLKGPSPAAAFKGKIVLVGETRAPVVTAAIPPEGLSPYPIESLAHAVSNIRQGLAVTLPNWATTGSWAAVLCVLLFAATVTPRLPVMVGVGASAVLILVLLCAEWGLLRYGGLWMPMMLAAIGTLASATAWAVRRALGRSSAPRQSSDTEEADRMMGLALQGQGQLDMAFDRLRKLPPTDALMDNLYHLAQDFERKSNFTKAKAAYEQILRHDRQYKDTRSRYKRVRAQLQRDADGTSGALPMVPPAAITAPRLPGDVATGTPMLGRYQVDKEIGKGAMGVVYRGRDPKIGRVVAIKTMALGQEFEGNALVGARERFFREAETAGRLQHPYIVTIFDAGEEHDLAYIAMEFLKGTDLAQACHKEHLLPISTVLSITARVADALDYAHAHHVVHRDIKPGNIMYDSMSDAVKVTDFGIARITDSSKTRTGLVLGTPSFMSPEQLAGKKVDGRSDLYALGVTLFQLLTGELPLRGESMTELMHKIATVLPPDVRQLRPEVSPAVAKVLALAMQKRPDARYQTGRQLAAELRQAMDNTSEGLAPPPAVVYDADRDATGHKMVDFQATVMESPAVRRAASPPTPGAS